MQPYFNMHREKKDTLSCLEYENDWCVLQFHSQIEICLINDGEMELFIDGKHKTVKKGDVSVAFSFSPHAYKTPVHAHSSIIFIPPHMCEEFMSFTAHKRPITPFISDKAVYEEIKGFFELMNQDGISEIKQRGCVYMVLAIILENLILEDIQNPVDTELISKILFYINENYKDNISPAQIAQHFGYSQSHISRYFKACCDINLVRYIALIRLRRAVTLMNEGNHDITYCILESGFNSSTTFYRNFKNEYGCSPKEYIKRRTKQ